MAAHINDGLSPPILLIDELGFLIAICASSSICVLLAVVPAESGRP